MFIIPVNREATLIYSHCFVFHVAVDAHTVNQQTHFNTTEPRVPKPPLPKPRVPKPLLPKPPLPKSLLPKPPLPKPLLPKPPPTSPEDNQPTPEVCSPESSPVQEYSFLLSTPKYDKIKDQSQQSLSLKVLALFRRFKVHPPGSSPQTRRPEPTPRGGLYWQSAQISAGLYEQTMSLGGRPLRFVPLPTIDSWQHSNIQPGKPSLSPPADNQFSLSQLLHPIRDSFNRPVPEWRKTLHQVVSLQGFRSAQTVGRFAAVHPQESPRASQSTVAIPVLQRGQAEASQRVVQEIHFKDSAEPTHRCFTQVIPLASTQNFVTSHQCGKTKYGKLQFDWIRG